MTIYRCDRCKDDLTESLIKTYVPIDGVGHGKGIELCPPCFKALGKLIYQFLTKKA